MSLWENNSNNKKHLGHLNSAYRRTYRQAVIAPRASSQLAQLAPLFQDFRLVYTWYDFKSVYCKSRIVTVVV